MGARQGPCKTPNDCGQHPIYHPCGDLIDCMSSCYPCCCSDTLRAYIELVVVDLVISFYGGFFSKIVHFLNPASYLYGPFFSSSTGAIIV